jgi:hypothetical protein
MKGDSTHTMATATLTVAENIKACKHESKWVFVRDVLLKIAQKMLGESHELTISTVHHEIGVATLKLSVLEAM